MITCSASIDVGVTQHDGGHLASQSQPNVAVRLEVDAAHDARFTRLVRERLQRPLRMETVAQH